ncbi:amidoligase family protein [Marivita sp. GX14005]|uniref:amidoligase family protein n=1 Tax=Marivita sp. GX14005 TaxID=2942276 RepID=UPI002018D30E|nr:amidoligase family protein [Marivita sp. GX14005]MCL3880745.1 amidoligase family protein [Marivita sp. GX14005]
MAVMIESFPALPIAETETGAPRHCGVEIEFAGPTERETADIVAGCFGGTIENAGNHALIVRDTEYGDIFIELDISLRKREDVPLLNEGLDLFRGLIPVELVTPPLSCEQLAGFDRICERLRAEGAIGSRKGVLHGFGVHLNPAVVGEDHPHTLRTIMAFGLLEPWLRALEEVNATRRVMPFVAPWPKAFVSDLAGMEPDTLAEIMRIAARHIKSRNHSLDLLPLFKQAEPALFDTLFGDTGKTSARPTFHFRLPDSRIDEPGWSLLQPWQLWRQVEIVAANVDLIAELRAAWKIHDATLFERKAIWVDTVDHLLAAHGAKVEG